MDHYETLGITKSATAADIKQAYRKLASRWHPDKEGGDTEKFKQIQVAYDILGDEKKRAEYDMPKHHGFQRGPGGFQYETQGVDLHELFRRMHERQARQHGYQDGFTTHTFRMPQIFRTVISVSLDDAYSGASRTMTIQTDTGDKVLEIDIPKGVESGDQIKYDKVLDDAVLIVQFRVEPHLKFDRRGSDLFSNFPISVLDLIAGTTIKFTTLSNKTLSVTIPPGTQPSMQLKMAGQGLPIPGTDRYGDQYLLLKPFIPDNIHTDVLESIRRTRPT
jgi:curved DNA-binding protein